MRFLKRPASGFKYAIEGVVHVFRTQGHMRFHFLTLILVLLLSLLLDMSRVEVIILLFTISLVLTAEMYNTAIEAVVDLVTQQYHPLAKFAKDVAAGAVLVAAINALAVGFLLFFGEGRFKKAHAKLTLAPPTAETIAIVAMVLVMAMAVMWKVAGGKGTILKGGVVSGHSAMGFFLATTILFLTNSISVGIISFLLAALVAQSRVEGGIHTLGEVVWGAVLATSISGFVYLILSPIMGPFPK